MAELRDLMNRRQTILITDEILARLFSLPDDVYVKRVFVKDEPNTVAIECVSERFDLVDERYQSPVAGDVEITWQSHTGDPVDGQPFVRAFVHLDYLQEPTDG